MRAVQKILLVIGASIFAGNSLYAQLSDSLTRKVDALFAPYDQNSSPGCALAIIKDGKMIYTKGYGIANLDYGIAITPSSVFQVGSISKQFTAAAIIHLSLQHKISLQDDIRKYIPQVPDFGHVITLNHLLHHTSGLRDAMDLFGGWREEDLVTEQDILDLVQRQKRLNFIPGEDYSYTNTGYTLLAIAVKKITGQSLQAYADSVFFKPLGMHHTRFGTNHGEIIPNRASAYRKDKTSRWRTSMPLYDHYGSTGLYTTVEDLAKWDENFDTRRVGGERFIEAMRQRGRFNEGTVQTYASGLFLLTYKGFRTEEHSGGAMSYSGNMLRFPDQQLTVIVLSNNGQVNPIRLSNQVADLFLPVKKPRQAMHVRQTDSLSVARWAGDYIDYQGNLTLSLLYKNGALLHEATPLTRATNHVFTTADSISFYSFLGNAENTKLVLSTNGYAPKTFQKVKTITFSKDQLKDYEGEYYSPELDIKYTLYVKEGSLFLKRPKYEDGKLTPFVEDIFTGWYTIGAGIHSRKLTITFARNKSKRIERFLLTTLRMRNVYFEKVMSK